MTPYLPHVSGTWDLQISPSINSHQILSDILGILQVPTIASCSSQIKIFLKKKKNFRIKLHYHLQRTYPQMERLCVVQKLHNQSLHRLIAQPVFNKFQQSEINISYVEASNKQIQQLTEPESLDEIHESYIVSDGLSGSFTFTKQ